MSGSLNEADFKMALDYISDRIGIELPMTNYNIFRKFLNDKLEETSLDCRRYLKILDSDKNRFNKFVDIVTINETYFFREEKHFTLLGEIVLPALKDKREPVNLWSAACSTGEEAISLFLTAEEVFRDICSFSVSGSDINEEVLNSFERGFYRSNSFREDGLKFHSLVKKNSVFSDKEFRINPEVIRKINRRNLNISDFNGNVFDKLFDVIFLRNTLIYFSSEKRKKIINSVVETLLPGGFLFLSATEMPLISHPDLSLVETRGTFYFQKRSPAEKAELKKITVSILQSIQEEKKPDIEHDSDTSREDIDLDLLLEYAADKLNNRIFKLWRNPNFDMSLMLIRIIYSINVNEIEEAARLIEEFEVITGVNYLTLYLKGYTLFVQDKKDQASRCFDEALIMNRDFWPADFYRAMILVGNKSEETGESLIKCITAIKEYISKDSFKYQIFLEGFNGKYFLRICEQWLKKI